MVELIKNADLPPDRSLLRITSAPESEPGREIAAVTIGAGVTLHEMRRISATLEDVFLELTTREQPLAPSDDDSSESDVTTATPSGGDE